MTTNYRASISSLVAIALCFSASAGAEKTRIAVLDLEGKGVKKELAENLTDVVTVALSGLGVFEVLSRNDIKQMLSFESDKQLMGCTSDTSCLAEIGGALGVALLVSGSVGLVGSQYIINITLTDTKKAKVIEREQRQVTGSEDKLIEELQNAGRFLVRSLLEGQQGYLVLKVSESGASVEIDGKLVGVSPLARQVLAGGPHRLSVTKTGFITWARDISINKDETEMQEATLVPSAEFIANYDASAGTWRLGAWISGGLGVAMLAGGTGLWAYNWFSGSLAEARDIYDSNGCTELDMSPCQDPALGYSDKLSSGRTLNIVGQTVGWVGLAVAGVSAFLFLQGPEVGLYDIYKTSPAAGTAAADDGGMHLRLQSFGVVPLPGGGAQAGVALSF